MKKWRRWSVRKTKRVHRWKIAWGSSHSDFECISLERFFLSEAVVFLKIWRFFCMNCKQCTQWCEFSIQSKEQRVRRRCKEKNWNDLTVREWKLKEKRQHKIFESNSQTETNEWVKRMRTHARHLHMREKKKHEMRASEYMLLCVHVLSWVGRLWGAECDRVCVCKNAVGQCV